MPEGKAADRVRPLVLVTDEPDISAELPGSGDWSEQLHAEFAAVDSDVEFHLRRRIQRVLVAAEGAINELNPVKDWSELADWLHRRLDFELRENHELAVSAMRRVSVRIARRLGLGESQIIDPPAPNPPAELSVSLAECPKPPTETQPGTILNVVLRGYLGFVMFFMLNSFTGLGLPLFLGLTPAALLVAFAIREERFRRLSARRTTANQLVRDYVTEFAMCVSKDTQDLLRRLEREIRAGYEARIAFGSRQVG